MYNFWNKVDFDKVLKKLTFVKPLLRLLYLYAIHNAYISSAAGNIWRTTLRIMTSVQRVYSWVSCDVTYLSGGQL